MASAAAVEHEPLLTGLRALLVDDVKEARVAMGEMLRQIGLRTQTAASGEEAIALAQAASLAGDPYDVVLIDWLMPHMDGIATARHLLAQTPEHPPECMLVSISNDTRMREEALELGITTLLQKPVSFSSLHDRLMELLVARQPESRPVGLDASAEQTLMAEYRGAKVLLAEDNLVNQEVAISLLQLVGLEVDVANTGLEAVARATAHDYALILMDMHMPELDGIEATLRLREHRRTLRTPVVAMTASAYLEDREACLAAGMNDYLTKPVDPPVLYEVLARWLGAPTFAASMPATLAGSDEPGSSLHAIVGLDVPRGRALYAGDGAGFEAVLRRYAEMYRGGIAALDEPVAAFFATAEAMPREGFRRELHSLVGASAAIGANRIADAGRHLERLLMEDAPDAVIAAGLKELRSELAALVESLDESLTLVDTA